MSQSSLRDGFCTIFHLYSSVNKNVSQPSKFGHILIEQEHLKVNPLKFARIGQMIFSQVENVVYIQ
jgi:hypothetical protein